MQLPDSATLAFTIDQAAHVCGVSPDYLRRAIRMGDLPAKRLSQASPGEPPKGKYLILRKELEAWLERLPDDWSHY